MFVCIIPYSMAGAASDAFDPEVGAAGTNGDAVVAGGDVGIHDGNFGGRLDVNSVGVGAVFRRRDLHSLKLGVAGALNLNVEHLAVL